MNEIPIVFTFDRRIVLGAAVSIKSLIDAADESTSYQIHIFHSDLSKADQKSFYEIIFGSRHEMFFHFIDKNIFAGIPKSTGSWTEIVYYRLIIPEILKQYDKVIYSDVDVFFKADMSEVFSTDVSEYDFAAVRAERNSAQNICHKYFPENKNEYIYWSGFLLLNCKKMREEKFFDKCIKIAKAFVGRLKFFDLDTINLASQKILALPLSYVTLEGLYAFDKIEDSKDYAYIKSVYSNDEMLFAKNNPHIIHYAGELGKPWQRPQMPAYYKKCAQTIPPALYRRTFRDIRKIVVKFLKGKN